MKEWNYIASLVSFSSTCPLLPVRASLTSCCHIRDWASFWGLPVAPCCCSGRWSSGGGVWVWKFCTNSPHVFPTALDSSFFLASSSAFSVRTGENESQRKTKKHWFLESLNTLTRELISARMTSHTTTKTRFASWGNPAEGMGDCFHLHCQAGGWYGICCTVFVDGGRTLLDRDAQLWLVLDDWAICIHYQILWFGVFLREKPTISI